MLQVAAAAAITQCARCGSNTCIVAAAEECSIVVVEAVCGRQSAGADVQGCRGMYLYGGASRQQRLFSITCAVFAAICCLGLLSLCFFILCLKLLSVDLRAKRSHVVVQQLRVLRSVHGGLLRRACRAVRYGSIVSQNRSMHSEAWVSSSAA